MAPHITRRPGSLRCGPIRRTADGEDVPAVRRRGAQQFEHGPRCEIAPFDPDAVPVPACDISAEDRRRLGESGRQDQGDLNPGKHAQIHAGRDAPTAHAQIGQPAGADHVGSRSQPHHDVDRESLAPPMLHGRTMSWRHRDDCRTKPRVAIRGFRQREPAARPRAPQSESPRRESTQSESPQSESPQSESPQSESPRSESPR